jgi:hypothetical protein
VTQLTLFDSAPSASTAPFAAAAEQRPLSAGDLTPEGMTRATFIETHRGSFIRYRGHRTIIGVQTLDGSRVLPLPANSQKNGRLLRPIETVLGEVHRAVVEAQVAVAVGRSRPGAAVCATAPADDVLADYPDLARSVALGIAPAALAQLAAQPTSYRQLDTKAQAPRTLAELKRKLETGIALTRFTETDPWPLHLVVRRIQGNAFVSGPVTPDPTLAQRYADGLWHHYEPARSYTFGASGFDVVLTNGRAVRYRYGHISLDRPCPALGPNADAGTGRH